MKTHSILKIVAVITLLFKERKFLLVQERPLSKNINSADTTTRSVSMWRRPQHSKFMPKLHFWYLCTITRGPTQWLMSKNLKPCLNFQFSVLAVTSSNNHLQNTLLETVMGFKNMSDQISTFLKTEIS